MLNGKVYCETWPWKITPCYVFPACQWGIFFCWHLEDAESWGLRLQEKIISFSLELRFLHTVIGKTTSLQVWLKHNLGGNKWGWWNWRVRMQTKKGQLLLELNILLWAWQYRKHFFAKGKKDCIYCTACRILKIRLFLAKQLKVSETLKMLQAPHKMISGTLILEISVQLRAGELFPVDSMFGFEILWRD